MSAQSALDGLRNALLALFTGFTLHNVRLGSDSLPALIHGDPWLLGPLGQSDGRASAFRRMVAESMTVGPTTVVPVPGNVMAVAGVSMRTLH